VELLEEDAMSEPPDTADGKNIVVLSDGTAKEGGEGHDTNVYKLFRMLENRTDRQVVFYDRGLGTGWRRLTGNAFGRGISQNILECYEFIFDQFQAKDSIYLFGFSRGAYTVRSLSGFLHLFGVLPKSRPELIKQAWKIYRIRNSARRQRKASAFIGRHHNTWATVTFLGVWDTVGALGFPYKRVAAVLDRMPWFRHKFHNAVLSDSVTFGCHALAIDDERLTFHPTFWGEPHPRIEQVWFAGMHSDVGGGYAETQLADLALQWMVRHAVAHGLRLYPKHEVSGDPNPGGVMHDSRDGLQGLYRRRERSWPFDLAPKVHASVMERAQASHSGYTPWVLKADDVDVVGDPSDVPVFRE
jgi:uncharacterized protein (DUF2235 family)